MFLDSGVVQLTRRCRAWPCRPGPASGVDAVSAIDLEWQDGHPGSKGQGTDLLCYPAPSANLPVRAPGQIGYSNCLERIARPSADPAPRSAVGIVLTPTGGERCRVPTPRTCASGR